MKKNKNLILIVAAVILMAVGFLLGRLTMTNNSNPVANRGRGGMMAAGQRPIGSDMIVGSLSKIDDNNLVIGLAAGGSSLALLSSETAITKMASGTAADLVVGQNVIINGSEENGIITVKSLQIRADELRPQD
jgi:hypothetical protein